MIQRANLGKILVLLWVILAGAAPAVAAEDPWSLIVRQQYAQAREEAEKLGGPLGQWFAAEAAREMGEDAPQGAGRLAALMADGDFAAAIAPLDSLTLSLRDSDPAGANFFRLQRGRAAIETGDIAAADSILTTGIAVAEDLDQPLQEFFGLYQRGRARLRMRQIDPPRQDLDAALAIATRQRLPRWAGDAALARSVVDRLQMDLDEARRWRGEALAHYREARYLVGQARALHYLGVIDLMEGNLARAVAGFGQALSLARQAQDPQVEGAVLGEMAGANYLLGNFDEALDQYAEAIRLVDHPWRQGMMLTNIGSIHEYRQDYAQAREVLPRALELIRQTGDGRTEAQVLMSLGEVLCELKEFDAGLADLDQALALAREYENPLVEAWVLKVKGHGLLDKGDLAGAAAALDEATAIARDIGYFEILEWSLLGRAMVARRQGHLEDALQSLQEALTEVDAVRRRSSESSEVAVGVTGQAASIYAETIDVMHALHRQNPGRGLDRDAFAVNQEAKARVFLNLLTEAEYDLNLSAVPGFRQQESALLQRLAELDQAHVRAVDAQAPGDTLQAMQARRAVVTNELSALEARLRREDPRYAAVLYPHPVSLDQLQTEVLEPGELFLDYALGDSASYLWAVGREDIRLVKLPPRNDVVRQVQAVLPLLADYNLTAGDPAWYVGPAATLYRTLLGQVADLVDRADRLIISPDGILHYLPFGALVRDPAPRTAWAQVPFLIEDKVILEIPSASILQRVRSRPAIPAAAGWLLVGDPELAGSTEADVFARAAGADKLPPLPSAGRELADLLALAPHGSVLLDGVEATVAGFKAAGARGPFAQVHLATHGLFNESHPRYSGLVLSPDADGGGFMSTADVFGLDLDCGQVVLAACATGLGRQVRGEGVVGLVRSFLFAGARSVVATLWNVSGEATAAFMQDYYRMLSGSAQPDRALALASVQRHRIAGEGAAAAGGLDSGFPGFWAGFVLSGSGTAGP